MKNLRKFFADDERGLVSIEWVSIAAVAFVFAVAIAAALLTGANNLGTAVAGQMNAAADDVNSP